MTDEQYNALSQFEETFKKVQGRKYPGYPGRAALQMMLEYMKSVQPGYRKNLGCGGCVRALLHDVAGHYFTEKEKRETLKPNSDGNC